MSAHKGTILLVGAIFIIGAIVGGIIGSQIGSSWGYHNGLEAGQKLDSPSCGFILPGVWPFGNGTGWTVWLQNAKIAKLSSWVYYRNQTVLRVSCP